MSVRLIQKPLKKFDGFLLSSSHSEVSGVYKYICQREFLQLAMFTMCIRYVEDCHLCKYMSYCLLDSLYQWAEMVAIIVFEEDLVA